MRVVLTFAILPILMLNFLLVVALTSGKGVNSAAKENLRDQERKRER